MFDFMSFLSGFLPKDDEPKKAPPPKAPAPKTGNPMFQDQAAMATALAHVPTDILGFFGDLITEGAKAYAAPSHGFHLPGFGSASKFMEKQAQNVVPRQAASNPVTQFGVDVAEGIGNLAVGGPEVGAKVVPSAIGMVTGSKVAQHYFPDSETAQFLGGFLGGASPHAIEHANNLNAQAGIRQIQETPEFEGFFNGILGAEGGGDINHPKVNPKTGAEGPAQVMPGTKRAPGLGVRPSDGTEADTLREGRDYAAALLKRYGGDEAKAAAAYNWGFGNLDKAIKNHGDDWLDHAPKETQDYVQKVAGGRPAPLAPPSPDMVEAGNREAPAEETPMEAEANQPGGIETVEGEVLPPEEAAEQPVNGDYENVVNLEDHRKTIGDEAFGAALDNDIRQSESILRMAREGDPDVSLEGTQFLRDAAERTQKNTDFSNDEHAAKYDQIVKNLNAAVAELGGKSNVAPTVIDHTPTNAQTPANENAPDLGSTTQEPITPPPPGGEEPPSGGGEEPPSGGSGPSGGGTGMPPGPDDQKFAGSINLNHLYISQEAKERIKNMAQAMNTDVQTHEETKQAAMDLIDKKGIDKIIAQKKVDIDEFPAHATAVRAIHAAAQDNVVRLASLRDSTPVGELPAFDNRFAHALGVAADAQRRANQIAKISGRTLSAHNIDLGGNRDFSNMLHHTLGADDLEEIARRINEFPEQGADVAFDLQRLGKYVSSYYYDIDMLSRVTTQLVNIVGNLIVNAFEDVTHLVAATLSAPQRMLGGDGVSFGEVGARIKGHVYGSRASVTKQFDPTTGQLVDSPIVRAFKTSMPADYTGRTEEYNMFQGKLSILGTAGKLLAAEDEWFRQVGGTARLFQDAAHIVWREGLTGDEAKARFNELINKPTQGMLKNAEDEGKRLRLQDAPGPVGKVLQSISHNRFMPLAMIGKLFFPFARMMDRSMMLSIRAIPGLSFADRVTRNDFFQGGAKGKYVAVSRQIVGGMMAMMAVKLALNASITGLGPSDPTQKAQWLASHQPQSMRIGDHWVSYSRLPFAGLLTGLATGVERYQENKGADWSSIAAAATMGFGHGLANEGWGQALSDMFDNFEDTKGGVTKLARVMGRQLADVTVPGLAQDVNKWVDPYYRDTNDNNTFAGIVKGNIQEAIPGASDELPKRYDVYGQPMKREGGAWNLINPLRFQTIHNDDRQSLDKLTEDTGSAAVTAAPRTVKINGQKVKPDAKRYQDFQRLSGQYFQQNMQEVMASWNSMTNEERQKAVKKALSSARSRAKSELGFDTGHPSTGGNEYGIDVGGGYGFDLSGFSQ